MDRTGRMPKVFGHVRCLLLNTLVIMCALTLASHTAAQTMLLNNLVTFEPEPATYSFTPVTTGCPAGFVGIFSFEARLTNSSASSLSNLVVEVTELTGGNLLQNADGGSRGVGARLTVLRRDGFTDGILSPDESVDVPFMICLHERKLFRFIVDVLGISAPTCVQPQFFCDDFSSGTAERWEPEGGVWMAEGGRYVGEGTFDIPCSGFSNNETLIRDLESSNVDVRLDMQSIERVDKGIILRSTGADNQIELNFRAERPGEFPADLIAQELVDCEFISHTAEFEILIPPHQVGETIHVRVKLIGNRLHVWIDGRLVLNRTFPFAATRGRVGLAVIEGGITAFDNVRVHVLK